MLADEALADEVGSATRVDEGLRKRSALSTGGEDKVQTQREGTILLSEGGMLNTASGHVVEEDGRRERTRGYLDATGARRFYAHGRGDGGIGWNRHGTRLYFFSQDERRLLALAQRKEGSTMSP